MPIAVHQPAGTARASIARFARVPRPARRPALALMSAALLALGACGGSDAPPPATLAAPTPAAATATLNGVAAIGAPIEGATVTASCTRGPLTISLPTSSTGAWTLQVPADTLPCALEASGGLVLGLANTLTLHSLARAEGRVNLTPLTDLAIARAAALDPAAWFAALRAAPAGASLDASSASGQLLTALVAAGYVVPGNGFDPFVTAFEAKAGDPVDAPLEAVKAALANTHQNYPDLVAQLVAGAGSVIHLPPVFTEPDPPQAGGIVLTPKGSAVAADIAPLVGTYHGNLGRVFTPGQPTQDTSTCTITVTTDGMMSVAAGGKAIQAAVNGDVGDLILSVLNLHRIQASDVPNGRYAQLTTVRGLLAQGVARNGGTGFTTAEDRVECLLGNPKLTSAGSQTVGVVEGATAADMASSFVGNYVGPTCSLSISDGGVMHLTSAGVDVTATLGGDENDVITTFATGAVLQARDYAAAGEQINVAFTFEAADPSINLPASFRAQATHAEPHPVAVLAQCNGLVKQ